MEHFVKVAREYGFPGEWKVYVRDIFDSTSDFVRAVVDEGIIHAWFFVEIIDVISER